MIVGIEIIPVEGLGEVRPGDDVAALLGPKLAELGLRPGDVVAVTQKIVSKAEGRVVPDGGEGRTAWAERESRRIVARRGDLVIAETRHGFVCANAGVDASNVPPGFLSLLPEDPDGSAESIRQGLEQSLGISVGVVVTDTFGRTWRRGVVNVAIGCAGLPAVLDLRGTPDQHGRILEATIVALADEVAAASGLLMGKASRIPAAIVRGVHANAPGSPAAELVRPAEEDLFRESPLLSISARRTIRVPSAFSSIGATEKMSTLMKPDFRKVSTSLNCWVSWLTNGSAVFAPGKRCDRTMPFFAAGSDDFTSGM